MITAIGLALWVALKGIALQLVAAVGTKWALERLFFLIGDMIVRSKKTPHNNIWWEDLKSKYLNYEKVEVAVEAEKEETSK